MAFLGGTRTSRQTGAQFAGGLPLWVIGSFLAASVLTELGPLLTAIVIMARVGAAIAAELAYTMVTEQIDALYAMGRDPVQFLVVPRVVAGVLVFPPLVILADCTGIAAAGHRAPGGGRPYQRGRDLRHALLLPSVVRDPLDDQGSLFRSGHRVHRVRRRHDACADDPGPEKARPPAPETNVMIAGYEVDVFW